MAFCEWPLPLSTTPSGFIHVVHGVSASLFFKKIYFYFLNLFDWLYQVLEKAMVTHFQYSCLENPMDGGAWWAAVHGVAKSRTRLSDFTFTFHFHALEKEMAPTPVFLPGESQGWRSLVGCRLWGRTESDATEAT